MSTVRYPVSHRAHRTARPQVFTPPVPVAGLVTASVSVTATSSISAGRQVDFRRSVSVTATSSITVADLIHSVVQPARARVQQPWALTATFYRHDGSELSLGPKESDWKVPLEVEFATTMPGGFDTASVVINRPDGWDPLKGTLLGAVEIHDEAGRLVYLGRVSGLPVSAADVLTIECEGYSKHAEDNSTCRVVFVDIDPSKWQGASTAIRYLAESADWQISEGQFAPNVLNAQPELWQLENLGGAGAPWVVNLYRSSVEIGSVHWGQTYINIDPTDTFYTWRIGSWVDDSYAGSTPTDTTGNLRAVGPQNGNLTVSAGQKVLIAEWWNSGSAGSWDGDFAIIWTKLAVYGRHGLTKRGSEGLTSAKGLWVSDMVPYIVQTFCPAFEVGTVETTSFVVPQAAYHDDTTPRAMLESLLLLGGSTTEPLDWWVYGRGSGGKPALNMASPSAHGNDWRLRSDRGASSDSQGYDVQERPNGVKVTYTDGTEPKTIGPTGSGADTETTDLEVGDPNHPANLAGIQKWGTIDVGMNSEAGAKIVGQVYLAEKNRNEWRGSIQQVGSVYRDGGAAQPPYMVRAGDRCVVETDLDTRTRYISATHYNSRSRTVDITISPRAQRFDTLLARIATAMTGFSPGTSLGGPSLSGAFQQPSTFESNQNTITTNGNPVIAYPQTGTIIGEPLFPS